MEPELARGLAALEKDGVVRRIWERDATVWKPEGREIADRLGWLDSPDTAGRMVPDLEAFAASVRGQGLTRAVVLGMGGSSLAPEVYARLFPTGPGSLELDVLDTTEPGTVAAAAERFAPAKTLFIVSSKSGTTAEVLALLSYFYDRVRTALGTGHAGGRFVAVTDPGTPLEALARELRFRRTFAGQPDIGGRFSALSVFGLVPAALKAIDLDRLLGPARAMADACRVERAADNPGALLGAILGTAALQGMDKLTLLLPQRLRPLAGWLEQLVAESTGKEGRGIVPIVEDRPGPAGSYGADRLFVEIGSPERAPPRPKGRVRPWSAWRSTIPTTWPGISSYGSSPRPSRAGSWGSIPSTSPTSNRRRRGPGRSWPPRAQGTAPPRERGLHPSPGACASTGWTQTKPPAPR